MDRQVLVTAGGNQAFAMVALALLDPGDRVLLVRQALQRELDTAAFVFRFVVGGVEWAYARKIDSIRACCPTGVWWCGGIIIFLCNILEHIYLWLLDPRGHLCS